MSDFKKFFNLSPFVCYAFIAFPPLILLTLIMYYGVNVILYDEWHIITYIEKLLNNNLHLSDLFRFYCGHKIFFPRLIMILNTIVANYNSKYQMIMSYFFILFSFFVIVKETKELLGKNFLLSHLIIPSFWMFTLRQWENLLQGLQFQITMMLFFSILSIHLLIKSRKFDFYFFASIGFSIISSFSFGNGLVIWIVGLVILFLKREYYKIPLWILFSLLIFFFYFYDYRFYSNKDDPNFEQYIFYNNIFNFLLFIFASLGSALTTEKYSALVFGIIMVVFYLFLLRDYKCFRNYLFFISLILFVLLSTLMVAVARGGFNWQSAISSRYVSFYIISPISLFVIFLYKTYSNIEYLRFLKLIIFLFSFSVVSSFANYSKYEMIYNMARVEEYYVKTYRYQTPEKLSTIPASLIFFMLDDYDRIRNDIKEEYYVRLKYYKMLEENKLSVFNEYIDVSKLPLKDVTEGDILIVSSNVAGGLSRLKTIEIYGYTKRKFSRMFFYIDDIRMDVCYPLYINGRYYFYISFNMDLFKKGKHKYYFVLMDSKSAYKSEFKDLKII